MVHVATVRGVGERNAIRRDMKKFQGPESLFLNEDRAIKPNKSLLK